MSAARLSPEGALAWLAALSIDLRATAVLDAGGRLLAGDPALGERVATIFDAVPAGTVEAHEGGLLALRSARHAVAAALGPQALERLVRADLRAALAALDRG